MFHKVMVGMDGRTGGRDALALARVLAPGATYVLANVFPFDDGMTHLAVSEFGDALHDGAVELLERERAEVGVPEAEIAVIAETSPARGLHKLAEEKGCDLLVIGSAHHGRLGRLLLGDAARGMLHGSPCAVAVAPQGYESAPVTTIGVPYDGSPEAEEAVRVAADLAVALGGRLRLVTAVEAQWPTIEAAYALADALDDSRRAAQDKLEALAAGLPCPARAVAIVGSRHDILRGLGQDVDFVVCGSRGWGALRRVTLGSTADRLMHEASCPVLVVPRSALAAEAPAEATGAETASTDPAPSPAS